MKAKFGKLSIGLYVACFVFSLCCNARNETQFILSWAIVVLFTFLGMACAITGAVKKESPQYYYIIGLSLNLYSVIMLARVFWG